MKTYTLLLAAPIAALFSSCASMQSAQQVADFNHDGVISDAEYRQYSKQKGVESGNVQVERMKRENAVDSVRDVQDTVNAVRGIRSSFMNF